METEILQLLHSSRLRWTKLNDILIEGALSKNPREQAREAKEALSPLITAGMIEIQNNVHLKLDEDIENNPNRYYDLSDLEIFGKILEKGSAELASATKRWYETENARTQYELFPKINRRSKKALLNSRFAVLLALLALASPIIIWVLRRLGLWPFE